MRFGLCGLSESMIEARIGVSVKLTNSETSVAMTMTPANGASSIPTMEVIMATGTNTTTLVSALAETAVITSAVPSAAAFLRPAPALSRLTMLSITTMEFVTRTPVEHPSDIRVIISKV